MFRNSLQSLLRICGDAAYRKIFEEEMKELGLTVDIIELLQGMGWTILPKRWRLERTFAWMGGSRRIAKDYEINPGTVESMIYISHAATLLKRLS